MRYTELIKTFHNQAVFSLNEIISIDPQFQRRRLFEWQQKGYIRKLIRGFYIFSDIPVDEIQLFEIANRIYSPSYVSRESALAYYGLIPEAVFSITSVSTRRTYSHQTSLGKFYYTSMRPDLFFGYAVIRLNTRPVKIALPEKALLDYLYSGSKIASQQDIQSLRLSADAFKHQIKKETLAEFTSRLHNRRVSRDIRFLLTEMENA